MEVTWAVNTKPLLREPTSGTVVRAHAPCLGRTLHFLLHPKLLPVTTCQSAPSSSSLMRTVSQPTLFRFLSQGIAQSELKQILEAININESI